MFFCTMGFFARHFQDYLVTVLICIWSLASQSSVFHVFLCNFTLDKEISIANRELSMASATMEIFQLFPQPPMYVQLAHTSVT